MTMIDDNYALNYPLVDKQYAALRVIANSENDGQPQTLDEIISRLPYDTTKPSFQFTLRALIKRGVVEKMPRQVVNGKSRRLIRVTPLGLHKIVTETWRATLPADLRTCQPDEVAKTDRLIKEIEEKFK